MKKFFIIMLSLFAAILTLPSQAAQKTDKSLYERLSGVFAIVAFAAHKNEVTAGYKTK